MMRLMLFTYLHRVLVVCKRVQQLTPLLFSRRRKTDIHQDRRPGDHGGKIATNVGTVQRRVSITIVVFETMESAAH